MTCQTGTDYHGVGCTVSRVSERGLTTCIRNEKRLTNVTRALTGGDVETHTQESKDRLDVCEGRLNGEVQTVCSIFPGIVLHTVAVYILA